MYVLANINGELACICVNGNSCVRKMQAAKQKKLQIKIVKQQSKLDKKKNIYIYKCISNKNNNT